jgi:Ca2+-binding EF-hand superfamily protein
MISRRLTFVVATTLALRGATIVADSAAPPSPHQDLVLLGPLEPLRVRLAIEVDGTSFRKVWIDTYQRMFDLFDTDRDGSLTHEQSDKLTAVFQRGVVAPAKDARTAAGAMMAAKTLKRDDLLRRIELIAPPLSLRQRLSSQGAGPALTPLLDVDGDGRLSREELRSAKDSLHGRDFNDDQLITQQELIAGPSSTVSASGESNVGEGAVVVLTEALDAAAVAEILLARYDRNRDGSLSLKAPAELVAADGGGLAALDADADQILNRQELRGFLELPIDAELPLSFGATGAARKRGEAAQRYRLQRKLDGGYRLHVGSSEVNFKRDNRDPSKDDRLPRLRDFDANADESLDTNELMNVPDRPEFAMLDTDRDGTISASEFDAFFLQRARIAAVQLVLEVTDQGADLFTTLDKNFDRVLTPRELQAAPELLATEDRDGDGFLGGVEMSYSLVLKLSRGGTPTTPNNPAGAMRTAAEPQVKGDRQGPPWFLKMDRNRDGDVSLAEFLGSRDTFRKLDQDGNDLLSVDEIP